MKIFLLLAVMLWMVAMPAQARVIVETDNFSDTISYRTYKNVGAYGIREYSFIKRIDRDENEEYYASSVEFAMQNLKRELSPNGYMGIIADLDSPDYKNEYMYGDKQNMKAYGFIVEKEYKYIDLCYYLFFPYNL